MLSWDKARVFYGIGIISMGAFVIRLFLALNVHDIPTWVFLGMCIGGLGTGVYFEKKYFDEEERFYKGLNKPISESKRKPKKKSKSKAKSESKSEFDNVDIDSRRRSTV